MQTMGCRTVQGQTACGCSVVLSLSSVWDSGTLVPLFQRRVMSLRRVWVSGNVDLGTRLDNEGMDADEAYEVGFHRIR